MQAEGGSAAMYKYMVSQWLAQIGTEGAEALYSLIYLPTTYSFPFSTILAVLLKMLNNTWE